MTSPVSITGSISLPKGTKSIGSTEEVAVGVEEMLRAADARTVERDWSSLRFTAGIFRFGMNWNVLDPFGSGTIDVENIASEIRLYYRASIIEMLIITTAMVSVPTLAMLFTALREGRSPIPDVVWVFAIGWLWLFGVNYVIGWIRFPRWLRTGLQRILSDVAA